MKKRNIIIIIILVTCIILFTLYLFLFGGNDNYDKYSNYQHININTLKNIKYTFDNNNIPQTYAIAHLNDGEDEKDALFYRVSYNDYIYISEIGTGDPELDFKSNYFYTDVESNEYKLFVHRATWPFIEQYILNEEKVEEKFLNFDLSKISEDATIQDIYNIKNIENNYIYFNANITSKNTDTKNINVKCSLKDYICIEDYS